MTILQLQQKPGNGNLFGARFTQASKEKFDNREVRGPLTDSFRGFWIC
jgi:hypothetical protein